MASSTFLEIFLLINMLMIGGVAVLAVQHLHAHFKPQPHEAEEPAPRPHHTQQTVQLPPEVRHRLIEAAQANFELSLGRAITAFQRDLSATTEQLDKRLAKLGNAIVESEVDRYKTDLDRLRVQAEKTLGGAEADLATHQAELKAKMAEDVAAEKQRLLQQIDTKLADAMASFLTEALQHNVDLGAQSDYLLKMLEEHKAELASGVDDEGKTAR